MLFDADVYDLKFNHECHELLSVGQGGACGDFLTQTVRHISSLKHETRPRRLWQELKQRSDPEVTKGSVIGEL